MQSTSVAQTKRSNEERHMRIGVLGTGMVGRTIAGKLVSLGHEVRMGSRRADNENAAEWVASVGADASQGTVRLGGLVCLGPLPAWLSPCRV
jgi:lactate dehydrogenase-like 2-hydroxyacid dehydrogenase